MFKVTGRYASAIAVFCAVSSFGFAAHAAERTADVPAITVRYADLNLNTPEGVEALYARLRAAAREACSHLEGRALVDFVEWRSCYEGALAAAISNVNSATLSALNR